MPGGGPCQAPCSPVDGGSIVGGAPGDAKPGGSRAGPVTGMGELRRRRHGRNVPRMNPTTIPTSATPITMAGPWPCAPLATSPTRPTLGPVVAVTVCDCVMDSFQIAVFRSSVKSAPGADVISCGTVSENVMVKMEASWSADNGDVDPGDGDDSGAG